MAGRTAARWLHYDRSAAEPIGANYPAVCAVWVIDENFLGMRKAGPVRARRLSRFGAEGL